MMLEPGRLTVEDIVKATGGELRQGRLSARVQGAGTDTRKLNPGALFIALHGPRFDGHDFVEEAIAKRAGALLVLRGWAAKGMKEEAGIPVIEVEDTLYALGELARFWRLQHECFIIAVTGSNGKTTTKEILSNILRTSGPVLKTEGNFNNLIGLPLTLLRLSDQKRGVIEMGMSLPGEITRLCEIGRPDVGLITNVNPAHLEVLKNIADVARAKGELFAGISPDGTAIINADEPLILEQARSFPGSRISFGIHNDADVRGEKISLRGSEGIDLLINFFGERFNAFLPLPGMHNAYNALAAVAAASVCVKEIGNLQQGLEQVPWHPMRMEIVKLSGEVTVINDCYNANPRSMEMALQGLKDFSGERRGIVVLGDMLELGELSSAAHRHLGALVARSDVSIAVVLGQFSNHVVEGALDNGMKQDRVRSVKDHAEATALLEEILHPGDWVLLKGSRGMRMETILKGLAERKEDDDVH